MTAPVVVPQHSDRRVVAVVGAAAFLFAGLWSGLVSARVIVSAPPEDGLKEYWTWYAQIVPAFQLGYFALLVALAALALTAVIAHRGRNGVARIAVHAVVAGMLFWAIATGIHLGGDRAVALLATHDNSIEATNSIDFALSWIGAAFELVGSISAGAGLVALAIATRTRLVVGIAAGVGLAALGVCGYLPADDVTPLVRLAVGGVLLPWWLLATGLAREPADPGSPGR